VRTETRSYDLSIKELAPWTAGPLQPGSITGTAKDAWDHLGVAVTIEPLAQRAVEPPPRTRNPLVGDRGEPTAAERLSWRVPRPVRVWVWRRGRNGDPALERVSNAVVVDGETIERYLIVDERLFGEASGTLELGELGAPVKASAGSKSALAALADALTGAPDAIATGLEAAKKAQAAYVGLEDAGDQHRLDVLKRRKDTLQAELDLKGLEATAEDFGQLKSLEQQVSIAEFQGKLTPASPSPLDLLKAQLELAKTQAALDRLRAGGDPGDDGPSIEDQLASLTARVLKLEGG
jgi:hypothetical protein